MKSKYVPKAARTVAQRPSNFSIDVIKHQDQGNLWGVEFIWVSICRQITVHCSGKAWKLGGHA